LEEENRVEGLDLKCFDIQELEVHRLDEVNPTFKVTVYQL